jgi:DNA-binding NarL/FixJ family response regulator
VEEGLRIHAEEGADLILFLLPLKERAGIEVLRQIRGQDPRAIDVVCSKDGEIMGAPAALEAGAFDYISNSLADPERLLTMVSLWASPSIGHPNKPAIVSWTIALIFTLSVS